jgi:hypothetical protein
MDLMRERAEALTGSRLRAHLEFVESSGERGRKLRHWNAVHGFAVTTGQEREMELLSVTGVARLGRGTYRASYARAEVTRFAQGQLF